MGSMVHYNPEQQEDSVAAETTMLIPAEFCSFINTIYLLWGCALGVNSAINDCLVIYLHCKPSLADKYMVLLKYYSESESACDC